MLIVSFALLLVLLGIPMYMIPGNGERREIGRIMFFAGLLGLVLAFPGIVGGAHVRIG